MKHFNIICSLFFENKFFLLGLFKKNIQIKIKSISIILTAARWRARVVVSVVAGAAVVALARSLATGGAALAVDGRSYARSAGLRAR